MEWSRGVLMPIPEKQPTQSCRDPVRCGEAACTASSGAEPASSKGRAQRKCNAAGGMNLSGAAPRAAAAAGSGCVAPHAPLGEAGSAIRSGDTPLATSGVPMRKR